jgi:hypothetical protein
MRTRPPTDAVRAGAGRVWVRVGRVATPSSIALWFGHANTRSTQAYFHADLSMKEAALACTAQPDAIGRRYQPSDELLGLLQGL